METPEKSTAPSRLPVILGIIGCLCFICTPVFVTSHLGFVDAHIGHSPMSQFLTRTELWCINGALGILGGVLLNYKRPFISGMSGLIGTLSVTGFTLLYVSWRSTIWTAEYFLLLLLGLLPGILFYYFIREKFPKIK